MIPFEIKIKHRYFFYSSNDSNGMCMGKNDIKTNVQFIIKFNLVNNKYNFNL